MKALKIILWFSAIAATFSGFINVILPWQMITKWMTFTGTPTLGNAPATIYMYRLGFMAYGMMGVFLGILARNPLKYGVMLPFAAFFFCGYALCRLIGGVVYHIPMGQYIGDVILCPLLGILILFLRNRVLKRSQV